MRGIPLALVLGFALVGGCFTAELDAGADAVFACVADVDCPEPGRCVNAVCHKDAPPVLEVISPEHEHAFVAGGDPIPITITIAAASLELRDPQEAEEHVYGEGHLVVAIDGEPVAEIAQGDAGTGVQAMVELASQPGAHRIDVRARRNDGVDYDNPEATATRLVWVADDQPHVAIVSPWPGAAFPTDATEIDVVLATIDVAPGGAHSHVYYGMPVEQCVDPDPSHDCAYLAIVPAENQPVSIELPTAAEGQSSLSAILRDADHSPTSPVVSDTIAITRIEPP